MIVPFAASRCDLSRFSGRPYSHKGGQKDKGAKPAKSPYNALPIHHPLEAERKASVRATPLERLRIAREDADPQRSRERLVTYRIQVQAEDRTVGVYVLHLIRHAPPVVPMLPEALEPLINHMLTYYGDPPPAGRSWGGKDQRGVTLQRWIDCCAQLCITSAEVARASFNQVCGRDRSFSRASLLDRRRLWMCLFFSFVRMRDVHPLVNRSSQEWRGHYEDADVLNAVVEALLPLVYNLAAASNVAKHLRTPRATRAAEASSRVVPDEVDAEAIVAAVRVRHVAAWPEVL